MAQSSCIDTSLILKLTIIPCVFILTIDATHLNSGSETPIEKIIIKQAIYRRDSFINNIYNSQGTQQYIL